MSEVDRSGAVVPFPPEHERPTEKALEQAGAQRYIGTTKQSLESSSLSTERLPEHHGHNESPSLNNHHRQMPGDTPDKSS